MQFSRTVARTSLLVCISYSSIAQYPDPRYDFFDGHAPSRSTATFREYTGSCSLKAKILNKADHPAKFDGSLTAFYKNLFKFQENDFAGPAVLLVIVDNNGKVCGRHADGISRYETLDLMESAVSKMKWIPATDKGHRVYFKLAIAVMKTDSGINAVYFDSDLGYVPIENQNTTNNPFTARIKRAIWKNWNIRNSVIPDNRSSGIAEDGNGVIWLSTWYGLARIDTRNDHWEIFSGKNTPELSVRNPNEPQIGDVAVDHDNNVWVAGNEFVAKYDGVTWTRFDADNSPFAGVRKIFVDASGIIWFCTSDGLLRVEGTTFSRINMANSGLASDDVRCIYEAADNSLWFATAQGLNHVQNGQWEVFDSTNSVLPSSCINFVTGDRDGKVWACGGEEKRSFVLAIDAAYSGKCYPSFPVLSLSVDPLTGSLWLATRDHGLVQFDGNKAKGYDDGNPTHSDNTVTGIVFDKAGGK